MLRQNDNQIMGDSYLQRISNFSNETKQQILQYANKVQELQNQPINQGRNHQKFEMQCRKETKHYLNCLRKFINSGMFKKQSSWLNIVLRLFGKKHKKQAQQEQIQTIGNQSNTFNLEAIKLINKPLTNHRFLIFLLICRTMPKDTQHYFDVELITLEGKIIYKIINLKNWQEWHEQIKKAKTYTHDILLLIQNRNLIGCLLENNTQLNILLEPFHDIKAVKRYQRINGRVLTQQQLQLNQVVFHIIDKYQLILQSLRYLIEPNQQIELSIDQLLAITFSYNIIDVIGVNPNKSLRGQIKSFQSIIVKVLEKEYQATQIRNYGVFSKDCHFPTKLLNAHHCLKCKIARQYVSCISCSIKEGKTIPLCLNCYESYHKELEKSVPQTKKQSQSTLGKWEKINLQVQLMMLD